MSFEDAYKLVTTNLSELLKNIYFFPRNENCFQLPSHVLKEENKWKIGVFVNDKCHCIKQLNDINAFPSYGLSREDDELLFSQKSSNDNFEVFLFRAIPKKPNPMEDKIKMLQDQIDELKKQVIL
jgi:hypothetical protein